MAFAIRRPRRGTGGGAGTARVSRGAAALLLALARLVRLCASLVVLLIVVAILLRVLDANAANSIVNDIHRAARTVVGPFHNLFKIRHAKVAIAVNWGIAAVVYLLLGSLLARILSGLAPGRGAAGR
jgi:hypothetical protein